MSNKVRVTAFATADCDVATLGDLRTLVKWCDDHALPDRLGLDWGHGVVYVELTGDTAVRAEMIECGDHVPPKVMFDVLVPTHEHKYNGPDNYEEALEMAESQSYKTETSRMYQDRINRYGEEARPE